MPIALRLTFASSFARLPERYPQRCVRTHKMIIRAPPLQMGEQVCGLLSRRPGAACERCHAMTGSQIHPLNKSGVQLPSQAHPLQSDLESGTRSQAHEVRDPHQLAPLVAFLHLAIDQSYCHVPPESFPPSASHLAPVTKMGCERIEVQI